MYKNIKNKSDCSPSSGTRSRRVPALCVFLKIYLVRFETVTLSSSFYSVVKYRNLLEFVGVLI